MATKIITKFELGDEIEIRSLDISPVGIVRAIVRDPLKGGLPEVFGDRKDWEDIPFYSQPGLFDQADNAPVDEPMFYVTGTSKKVMGWFTGSELRLHGRQLSLF
jgi:hypothetical protein